MQSNSELLEAVCGSLDSDEYMWVTNFRADPNNAPLSVWAGRPYRHTLTQAGLIDSVGDDNTFFSPAIFEGLDEKGSFRRGKSQFKRLGLLGADDADYTQLNGTPSYVIETSPGKHQIGILLDPEDPDTANLELIDLIMTAMADAKLIAADKSGNNAVRYMRLPHGANTKARPTGPWKMNVKVWNLEARYSLDDAMSIYGLDLDVIREQAAKPVAQHATSSNDDAELVSMIASGESYHDPLMKLSAKWVSSGMHGGAVVNALRGLMSAAKPSFGPELDRWTARYNEIPRMVSGAERKYSPSVQIALGQTAGEDNRSLLLTLPELGDITRNIRWMVKTLIPADAMGMLFGASGTFKSFVALDLSLHVAHQLQWCGRKTNGGSVVYVAAEGGAGIYRRVRAWHTQHGLSVPDNFHVCVTPLLLTQDEQVTTLREAIAALPQKPTLVVVDTLSQTFAGDENSSTDIANYLRLLNTHLRAAFGATVLVIHHTGHMASERPRGSSAITANLDFLLGCFRPNADALAAQVEVIKQKDGDKLTAQYFELNRHVLEKDEDGEEVSSLVASWHDAVKAVKESSIKLNQYEQAFLTAMESGEPVTEIDLRRVLNDLVENAATRRQVWKRTIDGLRDKRLIRPYGAGTWKRV